MCFDITLGVLCAVLIVRVYQLEVRLQDAMRIAGHYKILSDDLRKQIAALTRQ